jgi:hypothetical protein
LALCALRSEQGVRLLPFRVYEVRGIRSNRATRSNYFSQGYNSGMDKREQEIAALFLEHSCRKLQTMVGDLGVCLGRLTDSQIWERSGEYENAVGNLVLHLCGNMRQWIMHGVAGDTDVRVRDAEFSADGGMGAEELMGRFAITVSEAREVIASLPAERLVERINPQYGEVSVLEAIYQVVGHVQQHMGQIIMLTKQITEEDLDLTMPRPRQKA